MQSIIGRFAEKQFKYREKDTAFFDSVYLYNRALTKALLDLSESEDQTKRSLALKLFEENQKNILKIIDYLSECSITETDKLVFINAKKKIRLKRYLKKNGNRKTFNLLNNRQVSPSVKKKICDYTINNNNSLAILKKNVKDLIKHHE